MYSIGLRLCRTLGLIQRKNLLVLGAYLALALLEGLSDGLGLAMATTYVTNLKAHPDQVLEIFRESYPWMPNTLFDSHVNLAVFIVGTMFFRLFIMLGSANLRCVVPQTLIYEIRSKMTASVLQQNLLDLEKERSGKFLNLVFVDSVKAANFVFNLVEILYLQALVFAYLLLVLSVNLRFSLVGLVLSIPLGLVFRFFLRKTHQLSRELLDVRNVLSANYTERMSQLRFIKAAGTEDLEIARLQKDFAEYRRIEIRRYFVQYFASILPQITIALGTAAVFWFLLYREGMYREYFLMKVLPLLLICMRGFSHISKLNAALITAKQDQISAAAIDAIIQKSSHTKIAAKNHAHALERVEFSGVTFSYDGRSVLNNFDLIIERGRPVILRGPSGRGKTTVANLLRMLSQPQSGKILYNGKSPDEFGHNQIKSRIAYATQVPTLFYDTVRNNLIYGANGKETDEGTLWTALLRAQADEFVKKMPQGLDSLVLEKGANLSEGQKQRLTLARLLVLDSDLFIFDEITSALDPQSRQGIVETIQEICADRLCLLITHDPELKIPGAQEVMMQ